MGQNGHRGPGAVEPASLSGQVSGAVAKLWPDFRHSIGCAGRSKEHGSFQVFPLSHSAAFKHGWMYQNLVKAYS